MINRVYTLLAIPFVFSCFILSAGAEPYQRHQVRGPVTSFDTNTYGPVTSFHFSNGPVTVYGWNGGNYNRPDPRFRRNHGTRDLRSHAPDRQYRQYHRDRYPAGSNHGYNTRPDQPVRQQQCLGNHCSNNRRSR